MIGLIEILEIAGLLGLMLLFPVILFVMVIGVTTKHEDDSQLYKIEDDEPDDEPN